MSTDFDPYHRWLGIRPEDQPADHYRLLGLSRFEDDPEVIRDAAERQMGHVRHYSLGPHRDVSQRILNELGAARACLLNPEKKSAYDAQLRALASTAASAEPPPESPPTDWQASLPGVTDSPARAGRRGHGSSGTVGGPIGKEAAPLVAKPPPRPNQRESPGTASSSWLLLSDVIRSARQLASTNRLADVVGSVVSSIANHPRSFRRMAFTLGVTVSVSVVLACVYFLTRGVATATFEVTVVPPEAILEVTQGKASIEDSDGTRKLTIAEPDGTKAVVIRASLKGYQAVERTVQSTPGEVAQLSLRLAPSAAIFDLSVDPPEASVEVTAGVASIDRSGGTRKLTVPEPDGQTPVVIKATLSGYEPAEQTVQPAPGQESQLTLTLKPRPAVFEVSVTPAEAIVEVTAGAASVEGAGGTRKVTVREADGKTAVVTVKASREGYEAAEQTFRPTPGEMRAVAFRLQPLPTKPPSEEPKVERSKMPPSPALAPFDGAEAKRHQAAWAKHIGAQVATTNSIGMKLALIPPGEFLMGSPDSESEAQNDEKPQHRVRIAQPFFLGVHEVTQAEYEKVMGTNPSHFKESGATAPVETVSWKDAQEFCRNLSSLAEEQVSGRRYRLPTEAEWEYACRAGTTTPFHFGNKLNGHEANCDGDDPYGTTEKGPFLKRTTKVGSYPANAFGVYGMHGNVWEWGSDRYDPNYYRVSPSVDPPGPESNEILRVVRGGDFNNLTSTIPVWKRHYKPEDRAANNIGFRVVLDLNDEELARFRKARGSATEEAPLPPFSKMVRPAESDREAREKLSRAAKAMAEGNDAEARKLLEESLVLEPGLSFEHIQWPETNLFGQRRLVKRQVGLARASIYGGTSPQAKAIKAYAQGYDCVKSGQYHEAIVRYLQGIEADPEFVWNANNLAWLLATCSQEHIRDGQGAVKYARQACANSCWTDWSLLGTLAAGYAQAGDFPTAIKLHDLSKQNYRGIPPGSSATDFDVTEWQHNLERYRHGKFWAQVPKSPPRP